MMDFRNRTIPMMATPVGMQPGGYIASAYASAGSPHTSHVELSVERGAGWRIRLRWACPEPVSGMEGNPSRFVDGCAVMSPAVADAPWITMGAPGQGVAGIVWDADRQEGFPFRAEGLGTVADAPWNGDHTVTAAWKAGFWEVLFDLSSWPELEDTRQLALAVWRGAAGERGGLKSVSRDWVRLSEDAREK